MPSQLNLQPPDNPLHSSSIRPRSSPTRRVRERPLRFRDRNPVSRADRARQQVQFINNIPAAFFIVFRLVWPESAWADVIITSEQLGRKGLGDSNPING